MADPVPKEIAAGFVAMTGGQHAGVDPEVLADTFYSRGINLTSRSGLLRTRPGFAQDKQLPSGTFQGVATWSLNSGFKIVTMVSGVAHVYDVDTGVLTSITTALSATAQCYFCQAERFFVIQDGVNTAAVLQERVTDGGDYVVEARPQAHSIPIGTAMAFAHGRIHVTPVTVPGTTENGRPTFVSGDVFLPNDPSNCLNFVDETQYLNEGGAHSMPGEAGYIYAFAPLRNAATGTGYGNLVVFSRRGVSAFDVSLPRDQWSTTALGQVLYFGAGTMSPWSVVPVNGTLMYRGVDGLRLLSYAVTQAQSTGDTLSMVPQSNEVGPFMGPEDRAYLPRVSAAVADNRAYMTVGGVDTSWFKAVVVADFGRLSAITSAAGGVAYDGIWQVEGRRFGGVVAGVRNGVETLYAYMDDGWLWRLDESLTEDNGSAIRSRIVTRTLFLDSPDLKRLTQVLLWLRDIVADTRVSVYCRPMGYPLWAALGTLTLKVASDSLPQRRRGLSLPVPVPVGAQDPVLDEALVVGQGLQIALDWEGSAVVEICRCLAIPAAEVPVSACAESEAVKIAANGTAGVELGEYL